jgi:REP element-mobilizing transposase RayT
MPRTLRVRPPGGIFHVTARGNRSQIIYEDDGDRMLFMKLLADIVLRFGWRCHAYCLMTNHYHLLIETPQANLSEGMHRLNSLYVQAFNRRHGYAGHLFERRFRSSLVQSNAHLIELARYIVLNPVRAGLCREPAEWKWSSYQAFVSAVAAPVFLTVNWLLAQFGPDSRSAREAYAIFIRDAPARADP